MGYWDNITSIYHRQKMKGMKTYGYPMEDNVELNAIETLEMMQEEMVDMLVYSEHVKMLLKEELEGKEDGFGGKGINT